MTDAAIVDRPRATHRRAGRLRSGRCARRPSYYRRHRHSPAPPRPAPIPHRDRPQPRALSDAEQAGDPRRAAQRPVRRPVAGRGMGHAARRRHLPRLAVRPSTGCCARPARCASVAAQATHPATVKPELVAHAPNQVWSWDITKLHGPAKWTYYYLYVILDIFSRYVVGWMVASRESAALAEVLIRQTCAKQGIGRDQLTIHADRGSSMTSKPVAFLLADLGITQSHSRPHVSDDNPFSEAQFKTLKYRPDFPGRFDSIEAARVHCQAFFGWYNDEHRHTGLGLHTPADVHYGLAEQSATSAPACSPPPTTAHPERFVRKPPEPPQLPTGSWINQPDHTEEATQ